MLLWHPFIPYVTEKIWEYLNQKDLLLVQQWKKLNEQYIKYDKEKINDFENIIKLITSIRNLRAENKIEASKNIKVIVVTEKFKQEIIDSLSIIKNLAKVETLDIVDFKEKVDSKKTVAEILENMEVYIPLEGLIDIAKEKEKINQEIEKFTALVNKLELKLQTKEFVDKAPEYIVSKEKEKLQDFKDNLKKLQERKANLS